MKNPGWFLSTSSKTRYSTGAMAYFAQGIPQGLLHISFPAWLAVEDSGRKNCRIPWRDHAAVGLQALGRPLDGPL